MNRALCLVLVALGALMAAAAQVDQRDDSSASSSAQSAEGPRSTFRIITYNVQFLPGFAAWANRRPHTSYRAREIGRHVAAFDIVALNEVFDDLARRRLLQALREAAPGPIHEVASQEPGDHRINAGLMIVTRFTIVATHQFAYSQGSDVRSKGIYADGFAAKGVLHARLELPAAGGNGNQHGHAAAGQEHWRDASGTQRYATQLDATQRDATGAERVANGPRHIDVFVTHLESRDAAIRASQCDELGRFIAEHRGPGNVALMVGDFNIKGPDRGDLLTSLEYDAMFSALNRHAGQSPFEDVWLTHGAGPGGTSDQTAPGAGRRIDYILYAAGERPLEARSILVNPYADPRTDALSDHSAVEAIFEWR